MLSKKQARALELAFAHGDSKEQVSKPTLYCRIALCKELLSVSKMNWGTLEQTAAAISIMCLVHTDILYLYIYIIFQK
jgi:hypothetical protein